MHYVGFFSYRVSHVAGLLFKHSLHCFKILIRSLSPQKELIDSAFQGTFGVILRFFYFFLRALTSVVGMHFLVKRAPGTASPS